MRIQRDTVADVVRRYLPELDSEETERRLCEKLQRESSCNDTPAVAANEFNDLPAYIADDDEGGIFLDYFEYHIRRCLGSAVQIVESSPVVASKNTIIHDFVDGHLAVVSALMTRTLLRELYRLRSQNLLAGDTPKHRYRSFRKWMHSEAGHAELVSRYPRLFRAVEERLALSVAYLRQIISEVEKNSGRLHWLLRVPPCLPQIESIIMGRGDSHNGGKTVTHILFADIGRVLYKPRSVESEVGYNRFVEWLNDRLGTHLPTVRGIAAECGGFIEYVPTEPFSGDPEDYFARIGWLTGVLYLLKATDIHFENVITRSEGPVVVDTETLLTPRPRLADPRAEDIFPVEAVRAAAESAAKSGILPMVVKSSVHSQALDIGAIGYDPGQQTPFKTLQLRNPGRDDMFMELAQGEMTEINANLSARQAADVPVPRQREIVKKGLHRVLEHARAHPDEVAAQIEKCLGHAQFRYVKNPTFFYTQLLRMLTHPDAVKDPLIRSAILNRVALCGPVADEVADAEAEQLAKGDVPYFTYLPNSCGLFAGGREIHADAFEEPPIDTVMNRVRSITPEIIDRELRMVDFSFISKLSDGWDRTGFTASLADAHTPEVSADRFLGEAVRIGEDLLTTVIGGSGGGAPATWLAPQITTSEEEQWTPGAIGPELYGGSLGPALFLAGLAHQTGDSRYGDVALEVFTPLENQICEGAISRTRLPLHGMTGWAGRIYSLATAKRLLGLSGGMTAGVMATQLAERSEQSAEVDFVSGLAGTLSVCLALHRGAAAHDDQVAVEKATRKIAAVMDGSLEAADPGDRRVTGYTGYAHGLMGIGPILVECGATFDLPDLHVRGLKLISAALDTYDEEDGDWPREFGHKERAYAWCHGAPGMLMGALTAMRKANASVPGTTLNRLLELSIQRGLGNNPSYCHGDLGTVEALTMAGRMLPGLLPGKFVEGIYPKLFTEVIERYEERADNKYVYSNSMMVGRAGFGWSILRHLAPVVYPSILTLE